VAEALQRTARIAGDDLGFIDQQCLQLWAEIAQKQGNVIIIDKQRLLKSPSVLRRYLLRMSIEKLVGNIKDIEMRHIEDIMSILTKAAGKRLDLPGGLIFAIEYDRYLLSQGREALSPFPPLEDEFSLKLPGETLLPGWRIEANIINREQMTEKDDFTAHLDLDKADDKLTVRSRQHGDRFQPLGMSQPKKLGEFMIDAKIPQAWRERIPIVCSQKHILWVVGWRIDDRVKVTEDTKQMLCLKFERR
jgi:tRNA(Ile)-lysidine synthase